MLHGIEVSRAAAILKNIETYESAHYPSRRYIIIMITYCNKRRGLIYAEIIVGIVQQIFSYQLSGINCKYHAYAIILLPVIA